ncbi:hypothetical protein GAB14E_4152 [Colwellia psychrerythraea]|uniref:Uncharacterized protein n=1 Tax=Colwellia psychrerythraea TaxID=28229 RepID=A0A099KFP4_COLPS|nr:hypothetical protein GAB14E_4152 [Colwellia psychrerythraea]
MRAKSALFTQIPSLNQPIKIYKIERAFMAFGDQIYR